ncbi:MAG: stage 0 sporulation protein [Ruminococcaceae bacterium]|nr:stage 0 sporulation protein [Oscillospiraceae bacterium]
MIEIIGVRFKDAGKVYFFAPGSVKAETGDTVIVETARGTEYGFVAAGNKMVPSSEIVPPLRPILRLSTQADRERYESNKKLEAQAFEICQEKIREHGLEMKLIEAEYTFDNSKLLFYFSAEVRVDFRELVKDLASVFRTRIELRQIGIRDEAKMLGGLGVCGRPFCCATFLSDFMQVSIKMAKEQNLSLNSSKISGTCGRLMCCLRYEHETYEEEIRRTPPVDSYVKTPEGVGVVTETSPLTGFIKVRLGDRQNEMIKTFHRDQVTRENGREHGQSRRQDKADKADKES